MSGSVIWYGRVCDIAEAVSLFLVPCSLFRFRVPMCVGGALSVDVPIYPGSDKIVRVCPIQKQHMPVRWLCAPAAASGLRAFSCPRRVRADVIGQPDGGRPPLNARSCGYLAAAQYPLYVQKKRCRRCVLFLLPHQTTITSQNIVITLQLYFTLFYIKPQPSQLRSLSTRFILP